MKVLRLQEFEAWLATETEAVQVLVESRIYRIENFDHFGDAKHIGDSLCELRWKNGVRVYFSRIGNRLVLLLHGGRKNAQKNDIKKARILLERHTSPEAS